MSKKNITRLQAMLEKVEDADLKAIIEGAFKVEISYRSVDRQNFPRKLLREVVERQAAIIESKRTENQA